MRQSELSEVRGVLIKPRRSSCLPSGPFEKPVKSDEVPSSEFVVSGSEHAEDECVDYESSEDDDQEE